MEAKKSSTSKVGIHIRLAEILKRTALYFGRNSQIELFGDDKLSSLQKLLDHNAK